MNSFVLQPVAGGWLGLSREPETGDRFQFDHRQYDTVRRELPAHRLYRSYQNARRRAAKLNVMREHPRGPPPREMELFEE